MSDSKKDKFIAETKSVSDYVGQLPDWAKSAVESCKTYRDIDNLDKDIFTRPISQIKEMASQIPPGLYESFIQNTLSSSAWDESPIRLTPLLKINGKPFSLPSSFIIK